jgi:putative DNA methylase
LLKKDNKKVALKPYVKDKRVEFEIVGQDNDFPSDFEPEKGTISRAIATCLVCGSPQDDKTVRKLFPRWKSRAKNGRSCSTPPESKRKNL